MRILHVTPRYQPARGGAEIHLHEISTRLVAAGHPVTVVTSDAAAIERFWDPGATRLTPATDSIDGVTIHRFPLRYLSPERRTAQTAYRAVRRLLWLGARLGLPAGPAARLAALTPRLPDLRRWLAQTDAAFDLVAGMNITYESVLAAGLTFAQQRRLPFVIYPLTHLGAGARPGADSLSQWYTMPQQRRLVAQSSALVAQTPAEAAYYAAQNAAPPLVRVVGPGVNPADSLGGDGPAIRARLGLTDPIIFFLGKLSPDKGAAHLIEAVRQLWADGQAVALVLAGTVMADFAPYLDQLPPAVRARLHLLGAVSEQDKRDLYAAADLFAMPSRVDSFGLVYLDAWLYGKPVVAAQTWGVSDLIEDGVDGRLVPFGDVPALTTALADLLAQPAQAAAMGERGRAKVYAAHTWDRKFPEILALYDALSQQGSA